MARVIGWELDLLGSHGMAAVDYPGMLALIAERRSQPERPDRADRGAGRGGRLLPAVGDASPAGITVIDPRA